MKHKTFFWFVLPSSLAMLLFIALPIVSVVIQSLYAPHEQVIIEVENCDPFGCTTSTAVDQEATRLLREAEPLGRFVGGEIYTNRGHLAFADIAAAWVTSSSFGDFFSRLLNLPFLWCTRLHAGLHSHCHPGTPSRSVLSSHLR